jgi:hypothetical protein
MSGTHGVFQHRPGYFFTILEEDLCEVYRKEGVNEVCRAYITSILENLTNKQYESTGSEENIWVYMSLPEMARRCRYACSERTIHKELQGMIKDGYLFKRRATGKATMEYRLSLKRIRKALEALPDKQSCNSATSDLANLQDQSSNSARITLQNSNIDLANLQPRVPIEKQLEETEKKEEGTDAPPTFEPSHIVFEHAAGDGSLWYHSACVNGHYGASEGMILTAVRIERAPDTRCEMCGSNLHHAPFSDDEAAPTARSEILSLKERASHLAMQTDAKLRTVQHGDTVDPEKTVHGHPPFRKDDFDGQLAPVPQAEQQTPMDSLTGGAASPPNRPRAPGAISTSYRQVGKDGVTSATFEDIVQAQNAVAKVSQSPLKLPTDEKPRRTPAQQLEDELAHYFQIIEEELPGVVFTVSQRHAKNNKATVQAMMADHMPDATLRRALKKLSAWERTNFKLKTFYEEWMPAKLGTIPAKARDKPAERVPTGADDLAAYGHSDFDVYKGNGPEERRALAALAETVPDSYWE